MSGAKTLLPLYAFVAWKGKSLLSIFIYSSFLYLFSLFQLRINVWDNKSFRLCVGLLGHRTGSPQICDLCPYGTTRKRGDIRVRPSLEWDPNPPSDYSSGRRYHIHVVVHGGNYICHLLSCSLLNDAVRIVCWLMEDKLAGMSKDRLWCCTRYCPDICTEGLRRATQSRNYE
jgi:hypothetical protein